MDSLASIRTYLRGVPAAYLPPANSKALSQLDPGSILAGSYGSGAATNFLLKRQPNNPDGINPLRLSASLTSLNALNLPAPDTFQRLNGVVFDGQLLPHWQTSAPKDFSQSKAIQKLYTQYRVDPATQNLSTSAEIQREFGSLSGYFRLFGY